MPTPDAWLNHAWSAARREKREPMTATEAGVSVTDLAYTERNRLVAALARIGGWTVWTGIDSDAPGYVVVYVETPKGQLSWHVKEDEARALFPHFAFENVGGVWDGHTTDEKYRRVAALTQEDIR